MGVTIHFEGKAKTTSDIEIIISVARDFAINNNMPHRVIREESKKLSRVINGEVADYEGAVKGINIEPHYNADSLCFEFGDDLLMSNYCKTQFAPINVHIAIINLLKSISLYFSTLTVTDEGRYWETFDQNILQKELDFVFNEIDKIKKSNSNIRGPMRLSNGRIADFTQ